MSITGFYAGVCYQCCVALKGKLGVGLLRSLETYLNPVAEKKVFSPEELGLTIIKVPRTYPAFISDHLLSVPECHGKYDASVKCRSCSHENCCIDYTDTLLDEKDAEEERLKIASRPECFGTYDKCQVCDTCDDHVADCKKVSPKSVADQPPLVDDSRIRISAYYVHPERFCVEFIDKNTTIGDLKGLWKEPASYHNPVCANCRNPAPTGRAHGLCQCCYNKFQRSSPLKKGKRELLTGAEMLKVLNSHQEIRSMRGKVVYQAPKVTIDGRLPEEIDHRKENSDIASKYVTELSEGLNDANNRLSEVSASLEKIENLINGDMVFAFAILKQTYWNMAVQKECSEDDKLRMTQIENILKVFDKEP